MIFFGERCYSNQYDEISDDEISGFSNTTKFPTTKFPPPHNSYMIHRFAMLRAFSWFMDDSEKP